MSRSSLLNRRAFTQRMAGTGGGGRRGDSGTSSGSGGGKDGREDVDDQDHDGGDDDADEDDDTDEDEVDWKARAQASERDAAKWKRLSRKHEKRATTNADKARRFDEAGGESRSGQSRRGQDDGDQVDLDAAVRRAREEEQAKARTSYGNRLVDAEIRAQAADRLSKDQLEALLEGLDRGRFLEDDGEVDVDAVEDYVTRLAPARQRGQDEGTDEDRSGRGKQRGTARGGSGMGQGRGRRDDTSTGASAGRSRYQRRRDAQNKHTTSS